MARHTVPKTAADTSGERRPYNDVAEEDLTKRRQRQFDIVLPETGHGSDASIVLDGHDITGLLRGIEISSSLTKPTRVTLKPAAGMRAKLRVILPEAQITIGPDTARARRLRTRG